MHFVKKWTICTASSSFDCWKGYIVPSIRLGSGVWMVRSWFVLETSISFCSYTKPFRGTSSSMCCPVVYNIISNNAAHILVNAQSSRLTNGPITRGKSPRAKMMPIHRPWFTSPRTLPYTPKTTFLPKGNAKVTRLKPRRKHETTTRQFASPFLEVKIL